MRKPSGRRFNCRERALLPWLFLGGMAVAVLIACRSWRVSAAEEPAPAPPAAPVFDVAAIISGCPSRRSTTRSGLRPADGHFRAENVSVVMLIHWAYEMPETRILDAPGLGTFYLFQYRRHGRPCSRSRTAQPDLRRRPPAERNDGPGAARHLSPLCPHRNARTPHLRAGGRQGRRKARRSEVERYYLQPRPRPY